LLMDWADSSMFWDNFTIYGLSGRRRWATIL